MSLYDKCFPIQNKTITKKDLEKPWINETFLTRMKIRDSLYKASTKKYIPRKIYTDFRNVLNNQLKDAKKLF